ncbi:cytochrome P450 [Gorgonomyces haynaldii]|nr:cytochrome P450 [Gorgonomyces haynaldii]
MILYLALAILVLGLFWPRKSKYPHLPGPKGWSTWFFGIRNSLRLKSHETFMYYVKQYNFEPMEYGNFMRSVVLCDAQAAKQILNNPHQFKRSDGFKRVIDPMLHHALFVLPTGDTHTIHRKLIQPAFGPNHLKSASVITVQTMQELEKVIDSKMQDKSVKMNFHQIFSAVTLDIIGKVAFGYDLKSLSKLSRDENPMWEAIEILTGSIFTKRAIAPTFLWSVLGVSDNSPALKKAHTELGDLLNQLADERKNLIEKGQVSQEGWGMDVLQRLLMGGEEERLSKDEIFAELLGFFLAGHETTANTLTFAMYELCLHPELQDRLLEEVKDLDVSTPLESIAELKYLDNFMKETQRLHSIVGAVVRTCTEPVTVLGHEYPKGTFFQVYLRGLHVNPKYYTDPETFNPDRWNGNIDKGAFLPFSDGVHNCIGRKLAIIEFKLILAMLVKRYTFTLVPNQELELVTSITHGLKRGLQVDIQPRL